ncbi:hypothetical protein RMSM_06809 [Rhodopirellula maiorica SM1]|uniref:Uncharacterized protein n=1 Tax=Rhodopirellula maiorica SM1 TaxID=1265738 RepID=M5R9V1_9BACT|nr:hypothetical protein RMSM_06809 [Rhodopirellula maiorica SM1]
MRGETSGGNRATTRAEPNVFSSRIDSRGIRASDVGRLVTRWLALLL